MDRVEPIDGVPVPDPRGELGAIVARVTCGPSSAGVLTTAGCGESGQASSGVFCLATWDIVTGMGVEERGEGEEILIRLSSNWFAAALSRSYTSRVLRVSV